MTFFTKVWSRPSINDYRTIADKQTKDFPPNMERHGDLPIILFSMSNTLCLSKLCSGAQGRNALHHQRARFEDAARQFERAARDEA